MASKVWPRRERQQMRVLKAVGHRAPGRDLSGGTI